MNKNLAIITAGDTIEVAASGLLFERNLTMKKKPVSEAQENRKSAYLAFVTPVKKKLYNFINKCMNFSQDSEDIYQEALLKGFKYFDSYDRSKNFSTWLFTIASNLIKDHFRKQKPIIPLDQKLIGDEVDPAVSNQVRDIYQAVVKLKSHHRQVFYLFYYNEFKITEISAITGFSESNVKFILTQSRKTIKKILEVSE